MAEVKTRRWELRLHDIRLEPENPPCHPEFIEGRQAVLQHQHSLSDGSSASP
ncbi:hypothetical protein N6H18_13035 [Reichenbachiella agarivorans]|uniref:Uncharacterized protein n=1 Tax=Reichenbachiella agarivorans TaxID=2979464 RepID=A0ABY6CNE3_9BACT|nr:hypothetical protein [Reichenbachiella agarivorans]UXP31274.1 hypothetical protein N6H18_13035 [Reichenbachiella agarivorans]